MKIGVYTIALNEARHVDRWWSSVRNADVLLVADTGSTDDTILNLRSRGVSIVKIKVDPWRFDVARNSALAFMPRDVDVCISLDLDEYLMPGWRDELERCWTSETTRASYHYHFDDTSDASFLVDKIHARRGYRWMRPIHETIYYVGSGTERTVRTEIVMKQRQEIKETRKSYLPLLKTAYEEDPNDKQINFWYARELVYANHQDAVPVLEDFLKKGDWNVERSEAYRLLAIMKPTEKLPLLLRAYAECPRLEVLDDLADLFYLAGEHDRVFWVCSEAINRVGPTGTYLDTVKNKLKFYDYGTVAAWFLKMIPTAEEWCKIALSIEPNDPRLLNNLNLIKNSCS